MGKCLQLRKNFMNGPNRGLEEKLDDYPWVNPKLILVREINGDRIEIYSQADYLFKSHRHSYTVIKKGVVRRRSPQ